jgi:sugar (pentulose or hexulose) kinase
MPLVLGLDVGTTTITALAMDAGNGQIVARESAGNDAEITTPDAKARGHSDWDAARIAAAAFGVLRRCSASWRDRVHDVAGIGLTGQQHGVVLVDDRLAPVTPFVNWQDRRAEEIDSKTGQSLLERVRSLAGEESRERAGCTLAAGYMGVTLRWFHENAMLPAGVTACFIADYRASVLAG